MPGRALLEQNGYFITVIFQVFVVVYTVYHLPGVVYKQLLFDSKNYNFEDWTWLLIWNIVEFYWKCSNILWGHNSFMADWNIGNVPRMVTCKKKGLSVESWDKCILFGFGFFGKCFILSNRSFLEIKDNSSIMFSLLVYFQLE